VPVVAKFYMKHFENGAISSYKQAIPLVQVCRQNLCWLDTWKEVLQGFLTTWKEVLQEFVKHLNGTYRKLSSQQRQRKTQPCPF